MKNKSINFFMIFVVVLQLLLGIFLIFASLYLDEYIYLDLEGFFFHFMLVPGVTLVITALHYLLFWKYKTSGNFVFSGILCCFIIANTGECLLLLKEMFPTGWTGYILWFLLCEVVTCAVLGVFHIFFAFAAIKAQEKKSKEE